MAANSLLYLLLTTGLTTTPDQSVKTESPFGINAEYTREPSYGPTEDSAQWHGQTKWPGYGGKPRDATIRWRQETRYITEDPSHQYTAPPVTENENADWIIKPETEKPFEESEDKTYRPNVWPFDVTEEPQYEAERHGNWPLATEEPEDETERPASLPQKKRKRRCPPREHFTKCHKNCEKTCSDHMKPKPCPRSCKKGCVCDGGLVRNKEGKCVPRDQCPKVLMAEDDDSHGCPYEYACDVYCITHGMRSGRCEGKICKCSDR